MCGTSTDIPGQKTGKEVGAWTIAQCFCKLFITLWDCGMTWASLLDSHPSAPPCSWPLLTASPGRQQARAQDTDLHSVAVAA